VRGMIMTLLVGLLAVGCGKPPAPLTAGGQPVSYWLDELKKPDAKAREKAVRKLGHIGSADPTAIPAVIGAVKDKSAQVRREAVLALLNLGPAAHEAVPALTEASTKDADATVRQYAIKALEKVRGK
jgi:HEAT repeat protein